MVFRVQKDDDYAAEVFADLPGDVGGPTVMYPIFSQHAFQH